MNAMKISDYGSYIKAHGFDIVTWTLERSGPLIAGGGLTTRVLSMLFTGMEISSSFLMNVIFMFDCAAILKKLLYLASCDKK